MGPLPRYMIETIAVRRFRVVTPLGTNADGYHEAIIERLDDVDPQDDESMYVTRSSVSSSSASIRSYASSSSASSSASSSPPPIRRWDAAALATSVHRVRHFVACLLQNLPPGARTHFTRQHGTIPDDPADLSFWVAGFLPLSPYEKYELLPSTSVQERMEKVVSWIERVTVARRPPAS
ncbi:hypothetical protein BDK51DRAFT_24067 [Blyttiomyces helicus]|uniref:Lon N-terminal domain-containing protein n=1 Tax=Blyttiomyces helicus TaxID=388810 RepID=A0A4P9WLW4_9FUNG|nr:hypothetical protein BDK51DRAFT_24067 [Blyttiomyces helicus]|eukprot:RKO91666.1 hypothetical protein BDK51DRAFT_24067 [Blyttiomyces helicus]